MSEKVEGTVVLDGLLEGKVPPTPGAAERLREWIVGVRSIGIRFNLDVEGGAFSIMPENRPISVSGFGGDPGDAIVSVLDELLKVFPTGQRAQLFSTLRSVEYRRGTEVQTIYGLAADGGFEARERVVDAKTTAPPEPLTRKDRLRMIGTGAVLLVLAFLISSIFIDYREFFGNLRDSVVPLKAEEVAIAATAYEPYFAIDKTEVKGRRFILTLKRTDKFPLKDADCDKLIASAKSLADRLAVEALAKGYIRCEMFGNEDKYAGFTSVRIMSLRLNETIELELALPSSDRLTRIVLTY